MKLWITFWNILAKDFRTYYLKSPNISWGLIFPLAWTGMFFINGLFFPISALPVYFKPLFYALPLTYGADMLHGVIHGGNMMSSSIDMAILAAFCTGLFMVSIRNIRKRWIV